MPKGAFAYLRGLRRDDGSYRYSRRYVATPVWVTAQVLPAVLKKPFPLAARRDLVRGLARGSRADRAPR